MSPMKNVWFGFIVSVGVIAAANCLSARASDFVYSESFATGGTTESLAQTWKCAFGWSWRDKALRYDLNGPSFAILREAPWGESLEAATVLNVSQAVGTQWKVAGITMKADAANYWHLALIESPNEDGSKHSVELTEMRNSVWLAQANLQPLTFSETMGLAWKYEHPYRLRITVDPKQIVGVVEELDGTVLWKAGFEFSGPAVKQGKPGFHNSGFRSAYSQFKTRITDTQTPPEEVRRDFPEYTSAFPNQIDGDATGFFYTRKIDGSWWIIAPDGSRFYAVATDHVSYLGHWCEALGYAPYHRNVEQKYGAEDAWAEASTERLRQWGFNTLGAGCHSPVRHHGLAHTAFIGLGGQFCDLGEAFRIAYPADGKPIPCSVFPNVFHPQFEEFCRSRAEEICTPNQNDPWLIGYFIDNELKWWGTEANEMHGLFDETMKRPASHTAKKALIDWLRKRYKTTAALNDAWDANIESFGQIAELDALTGKKTTQMNEDKVAFVYQIVDRYFEVTTRAIRQADPNHMVLGCRLAGLTNPSYTPAWVAAGKHCDIVTVNVYEQVDLETGETYGVADGVRTPLTKMFDCVNQLAGGAPFWVTEWSYPAYDSGLPCMHGAGQRVNTQAERAFAFSRFQQLLFGMPYMVGSSFFMWSDEPALGIAPWFPEDSNYGLVSEQDEPYQLLTETCARLNPQAIAIHDGRTAELQVSVRADGVFLLKNQGLAPGDCKVTVWVDGQTTVTEVALPPGGIREITVDEPVDGPGGHFVRCSAELVGAAPEIDLTDNTVEQIFNRSAPSGDSNEYAALVVNPSAVALADVPFVIKASALSEEIDWPTAVDRLRVVEIVDGIEKAVPSQLDVFADESELAGRLNSLPTHGARNLVIQLVPQVEARVDDAVSLKKTSSGFEIDNGRLKLARTQATGHLFSEVELDGVELGGYSPMLHQKLPDNAWNLATKVVDLKVDNGPVRLVLTAKMSGGEGTAAAYETACRIVIYPNSPWMSVQALWAKNCSEQSWRLASYFHCLPSRIGGDAADDATLHDRWFDAGAGFAYGAFDPTKHYQVSLWKDENGEQHPDAWRRVDVDLAPGQTHHEPPAVLYIGGVEGESATAWNRAVKKAQSQIIRCHVFGK